MDSYFNSGRHSEHYFDSTFFPSLTDILFRFTSQVTKLFFKDPTIGLALSYVVFGNAFGFWVYLSIGPNHVPRASILLCMLMVISHLLLIFPFLAYLFYFLEPDKVVTKIMMAGLKAASDSINHHGRNIDKQQVRATLAVEHLMDAANSAVKRKDKVATDRVSKSKAEQFD